ncbi:hypothetical protein [Terrimonas alba]|uniref:hypothetical protein n=1 Tax=Terrimonas alba TaxID=3349636 RepID=UPI0035F21D8E
MAFFLDFATPMRKTLIIGLMLVHLFAHTEVGQVFRLPNLLSHFFQHHRQNPRISFFDFIAMHYGGDDGTHADDDRDDQLPCHNINNNTLSIVYSVFENDVPSLAVEMNISAEYGSHLQPGNPSEHVLLVLQPPRQA